MRLELRYGTPMPKGAPDKLVNQPSRFKRQRITFLAYLKSSRKAGFERSVDEARDALLGDVSFQIPFVEFNVI
jgi:hypothetical protein